MARARKRVKGRRGGKGAAPAWYESNWFLLVLAIAVVVGVRVYQTRFAGGDGGAIDEGAVEDAAGGGGEVRAPDASEGGDGPEPLDEVVVGPPVTVPVRTASGAGSGAVIGAGADAAALRLTLDGGELPAVAVGAEGDGAEGEAPRTAPDLRGAVRYAGLLHDELVVPSVDPFECPEHPAGALQVTDGKLAGALVWLDGTVGGGAGGGEGGDATLRIASCQLTPRAQVVAPGTTLRIDNGDAVEHTLVAHDAGGTERFRTAVAANGGAREIALTTPGLLRVTCTRHPWETSHLLVHAAGAVTDVDGRFTVPSPAAGSPTVHVFHPLLGTFEQQLELTATTPLILDVDLTESL